MHNEQLSTCPILPKFHLTWGEPIERQEVSVEYETLKDSDPRKSAAHRMLGRIDEIKWNAEAKLYLVTDDYGVNVMYDCVFADMSAIESEILKIVSLYINKLEPI